MIVFLKRLSLLLVACHLFQLTIADNDTDYHSNEDTQTFSSTLIVPTTVDNTSNDASVIDDHKNDTVAIDENTIVTNSIDDIPTSTASILNSTKLSTSLPLDTAADNVIGLNTTLNEAKELTTLSTPLNEIQAHTEKIQAETTSFSNASCETSTYGCCTNGTTRRQGPNSDGCHEETTIVTVLNATSQVTTEAQSVSLAGILNATIKTEETEIHVESTTENIVTVTNEATSAQNNVNNVTVVAVHSVTMEETVADDFTTIEKVAVDEATTVKAAFDNITTVKIAADNTTTIQVDADDTMIAKVVVADTTMVQVIADETTIEEVVTDETVPEQVATDETASEQAATVKTTPEQAATVKTTPEQAATVKTTSEQAATMDSTLKQAIDTTTMVEAFESSTLKFVEITTETSTTTAQPVLCVDTEFECCLDGKTAAKGSNFQECNTMEKWTSSATKNILQTVCELEKDPGSCSKYVNMWAYDRQQGKCVRFWYGSCEGNGNRFETEQQCQETCISPKGIEVCLLPKISGPCHLASNRYYYDHDKKTCQQFRYGGCNGNANNYDSLEKCQSTCNTETVDQCSQPVEIGPCKGEYTRFYYDIITGQCRSFLYGGCKKNENNFLALKDCLRTCVEPRQKDICLLPKIIGTCQERRPTWYFDMTQRECKLFQYSGCGGNHNQFSSQEECELSCSSLKTSAILASDIQSICNLPVARGSCDQQISRWHYNPNDQYCYSFQYTGCHGNANSFETEQDCRETCQAKEKDICTLEKDPGPCDQYKMMWYYDSFSKECKNFFYGSCGGNGNRFATEQECQLRCLIKPGNSTCLQQVDQGYPCNDTKTNNDAAAKPLLKFFYDQQLRKCSSFLYQGCGGNDNRFNEENQCNEKCVQDIPIPSQPSCGSNMIRCNIQCRFGFERDSNGCEICRCIEPCQRQQCPRGYECVVIPEQTQCSQVPCPVPRVECQPIISDPMGKSGIKPVIENAITNIFAQFDANVTIPCTLRQGFPTPVVYWYKERQQLQVHDAMSTGIIVRKIERLPDQSLIIRKATLEDQGLYTCRAINQFGEDIKDVQLDIFDPIKVEIYPINRIYQLGFTAKLHCRATGYPSPKITWMRHYVPLINTTRMTIQYDGSLIIHPYKHEDAGPYVCNATNKKESVTQVAYLEVKETRVEPVCEDQPAFANCELVVRHNFCDVYFDYCCRTCSQQGQFAPSSSVFDKASKPRRRRQVFLN